MNEKIILEMVRPYLVNNQLTYKNFNCIFDMLSTKEQYEVINILYKQSIELVDSIAGVNAPLSDQDEEEDFDILYDESLFQDDFDEESTYGDEEYDEEGKSERKNNSSRFQALIVRKEVKMSNETLISLIQEGNEQARQDLCIKNRGLVDKYVNGYMKIAGNKLEFEDLEQVGMLGMLKAAERFDFKVGTTFSTYATWWIKQSISRAIDDTGFTIRIPVHKMDQIFKVCRLDSQLAEINNFNERMEMISLQTGYPQKIVEDCIRLYHQFLRSASLDVPIGEDGDTPLGDMIPIEGEILTDDIVIHHILREQIEEVLSTLTKREQTVIKYRFGLIDGKVRTLEEVGEMYGVTRERIRQIEAKALRKLRHPSRNRKLKDFLN